MARSFGNFHATALAYTAEPAGAPTSVIVTS
jgi:hypothetical protein